MRAIVRVIMAKLACRAWGHPLDRIRVKTTCWACGRCGAVVASDL